MFHVERSSQTFVPPFERVSCIIPFVLQARVAEWQTRWSQKPLSKRRVSSNLTSGTILKTKPLFRGFSVVLCPSAARLGLYESAARSPLPAPVDAALARDELEVQFGDSEVRVLEP